MKHNLFAFLVVFAPLVTQARWAEPSDAAMVVNFDRNHYRIRKNGTFTMEIERQIEILKDSARTDYGLMRLTFDGRASKFRILEAKTINGAKSLPVPRAQMEQKPLASSGPGFDDTVQATVPFPDVKVGSKLYVHYRLETTKPPIPGYFQQNYVVGWNEYVQSFDAIYDSDVPIYGEVNDPDAGLVMKSAPRHLEFHLTKPYLRIVRDEEYALFEPKSLAWVGVSTAKSYADVPRKAIDAYEKTMHANLPADFEEIRARAAKKTSDVEQINEVTSGLAVTLRYVGDWRLVEGSFFPRSLATISKTGYGDCKDFTVSTGSILSRLGYDVSAAWIARGKDRVLSPLSLAAPDVNHAILFARKNGHEYWVDPTNTTSFAQGLYPDIADRPAILLAHGGYEPRRTPPLSSQSGEISYALTMDFSSGKAIVTKGEFALNGSSSLPVTAIELSTARPSIDYSIVNWIADVGRLSSWKVGAYDFHSRVVSDVKTTVEWDEVWRPALTTLGPAYVIAAPKGLVLFRQPLDQRVGRLNIDEPVRWHREEKLTGRDFSFAKDIRCEGKSPWADYSREIAKKSGAIFVKDAIDYKATTISVDDYHSKEYADFRNGILECLQDAIVVFE